MLNLSDAWNHIEQLSAELVTLAETGDWEALEAQLAARDAEISRLLNEEVPASLAGPVRSALEKISVHNTTLERLAVAQRQATLEALRKGGSGNKMKAAYTKVQRSR